MQILSSALVLGLVCLDSSIATASPKLNKRTITVNRVAAGWIERDVLHMKVQALQKFGMPMSDELKQAHVVNRAQAKNRAEIRQKNIKAAGLDMAGAIGDLVGDLTGGATANNNGNTGATGTTGKGTGNGAGVSTVTVTITSGASSAKATEAGRAGEGTGGRTNGTTNGNEGGTGAKGDGGKGNGGGAAKGTGSQSAGSAKPTGATGSTGGNGNAPQATGQTGNVQNIPEPGDVEYLSEVVIGGQKIVMNFDTGSSDFWVFSTNLNANSQKGHTVYDPSKSTTFTPSPNQKSFAIRFGDGSSASGTSANTIGTEVVSIGGAVAQKATVELADTVSGSFITDVASNGLVGFAFSKLNTVKPVQAKTFFDTIADDLQEPILAADLRPGVPGSYTLGKVDNTAFKGQLTEVPINNTQGFWQFQSNTFSVGTGGQVQTNKQNSPAIADTGTTLLLADDDVINGYYSKVQGAALNSQTGLVTYPCGSNLPDLSLAVGNNYTAVIPGKLINFQAIDKANTTCAGALQSNNGAGIQIYGDIFFKAQYTVFDVRKNALRVAPHA